MTRKNTILVAVLINAGLLAVLLITALTTQEELVPASSVIGEASKLEDKPLFGDLDLARGERSSSVSAPEKKIEVPIAVADEAVTHKLPPLAEEPAPAPTATAPVAIAPAPSSPPASAPSPSVAPGSVTEVAVKKGDSLEKIAKKHHMTVDEVIKLNHLPSSFLKVGQILKVQADRSFQAAVQVPETKVVQTTPEYYTIKVGDNPWAIAMKHKIKVSELLQLNGLNEEKARKLKPGDRLRVK